MAWIGWVDKVRSGSYPLRFVGWRGPELMVSGWTAFRNNQSEGGARQRGGGGGAAPNLLGLKGRGGWGSNAPLALVQSRLCRWFKGEK